MAGEAAAHRMHEVDVAAEEGVECSPVTRLRSRHQRGVVAMVG